MKKTLVILLAAVSLAVWGRDYRNIHDKNGSVSYSFRLVRKYNDRAGFFTPLFDRALYMQRAAGNANSARGGGGERIVTEPVYRSGEENRDIIIVGLDLKKMVDNDVMPLNQRVLYQIGQYTTSRGYTFAVFSTNRNARVDQYLPQRSAPAGVSSSIDCPHCGREIKLNPSK